MPLVRKQSTSSMLKSSLWHTPRSTSRASRPITGRADPPAAPSRRARGIARRRTKLHVRAADLYFGPVCVDQRKKAVLPRQLIIGEFLIRWHVAHGTVPDIAGQVGLLGQREIPHVKSD